jgi:bifunctional enzyme CysN/CysC
MTHAGLLREPRSQAALDGRSSARADVQDARGLSLVVGGHVDHGKSTIIGRLLADSGSLPEGKLEAVRTMCERTSRPFEYAFLLDALKDEQAQGITIDMARVFFRTALRPYMILDAPGHIEFLRNFVTGAARADAALLVIDASEGVRENSRRHGYMMGMLGIRRLVVLVNKMDLVGYDEAAFRHIETQYARFLARARVRAVRHIPVSGREGDNVARRSSAMPWYRGPTVLEALDEFRPELPEDDHPFRMPVQDVYKFTRDGDDRRIVAGSVTSGRLCVGDEVVFHPSGKKARVATVEGFNRPSASRVAAGAATGFTLEEQIYITRGEMAARAGEQQPLEATRIRVSLFWLGTEPMVRDKDYLLKLGTARVRARIETIHSVLDASTLATDDGKRRIDRNEVAECTLALSRPIACDLAADLALTSRFVIVDDYEIRGGGIVRESLPDAPEGAPGGAPGGGRVSNYARQPSAISGERRSERYRQRPTLILVSGSGSHERIELARALEQSLFESGRLVYFLGTTSGGDAIDADVAANANARAEPVRRVAEIAPVMLDAGVMLVATVAELSQGELESITASVDRERIVSIWAGGEPATDVDHDVVIEDTNTPEAVERVQQALRSRGVIFGPP